MFDANNDSKLDREELETMFDESLDTDKSSKLTYKEAYLWGMNNIVKDLCPK